MIVMLQFRDDISEPHEQQCVMRHAPEGQTIRFVSVFDKAAPYEDPARLLEGADGLIVGASGGISMHDQDEKLAYVLKRVRPVIDYVLDKDFPTLGFCFGHHLLAQHLGSRVEKNEEMREAGFFEIELTPEGQADPAFEGAAAKFWAPEGHQDSVLEVPRGATLLAKSERCLTQAIRYTNNILSTQFHGELTADDLIERLQMFPHYVNESAKMEKVPTPYSVTVLRNFMHATAGVGNA
jgi:GMP synthase-like glutamine amidotransferase